MAGARRGDGDGYPDGLAGERIPISSRIVFVCDAYDAMRAERPYGRALGKEQALEELRSNAGTQFDPELVTLFCAAIESEPVARAPAR